MNYGLSEGVIVVDINEFLLDLNLKEIKFRKIDVSEFADVLILFFLEHSDELIKLFLWLLNLRL